LGPLVGSRHNRRLRITPGSTSCGWALHLRRHRPRLLLAFLLPWKLFVVPGNNTSPAFKKKLFVVCFDVSFETW
jgi:hypothetical protein